MTAAEERAAVAIRVHLWRGRVPRPDRHGRWHIGRDVSIWRRLVRAGYDPDELTGAIAHVRHVAPWVRCMAPLASKAHGPPILEQAVHRYRQGVSAPRNRSESQPTALGDLLRGML